MDWQTLAKEAIQQGVPTKEILRIAFETIK